MQKYVNNYKTTLYAAINDTQTSIQVPYSTEFDDLAALSGGDFYLLTISDSTNKEIIKVTAVGAGPIRTLTVERDVSETAHGSFSFSAGSKVEMYITAESMNALSQMASSIAYPPNLTANTQTFLNPGDYPGSPSTLNIPFSPLVVQQINVETSTPELTVNVTAASSPSWGESIINLYRSNATWDWPTFTVNGNPVGNFMGQPPESGVYFAQVVCRKTPGSGYLSSYTVSLEWVTKAEAGAGDSDYLGPFGATNLDHGLILSGSTLAINPLTQGYLHSAAFQSGATLNISTVGGSFTSVREVIVSIENAGGWPAILLQGSPVTPAGQAPNAEASVLLRVIMRPGAAWYAEWLTSGTAGLTPFTSERIDEPLTVPSYGSGFASTLTINYSGGSSVPTSRMARFVDSASIDFVFTGVSDDAAWSGVREFFVILYATTTHIPTIKHNGVTITPSGSAPAIIPPPVFPATVGPPAGMLKVTAMIYDGWKKVKAEWVVFQ
jgi:hypothetical protein